MIEKIKGLSMDIEQTERKKLMSIFPQCFSEGKLDIDKLLNLCGEYIDEDFEKYKFEWKGKAECHRIVGKRSTGTLRPCVEESVNFDTTKNLYIEGDNLEVLKLLQTTYFRKIKMIYIDPPYNTGGDFVYFDNFTDPIAHYKEVTSQATKSNPESMGRFHTAWLNMMWPRIRMAHNLLRDDGVMFISIDDHELFNLKKLCDEVFGEENYISTIACVNKPSGRSDDKYIATAHESILVYRKSDLMTLGGFVPDENILRRYSKTDETGQKYREEDLRKRGSHDERVDRPNLFYPFFYNQETKDLIIGANEDETPIEYIRIVPMKTSEVEGNWRWSRDTANEMISYLHPRYMPNKEQWSVFEWEYLSERDSVKPTSVWDFKDVNSERGSETFIKTLGFGKSLFPNPKPVGTIERIIRIATELDSDDIILDFFSGSATTAHAVMQLNAEDGGNRKFVMVQLPEITDEKSEAYKAGYKNICEIGKERIRRAGLKILAEQTEKQKQMAIDENGESAPLDVGFRVLKLDTSNLVAWDATPIRDDNQQELWSRIERMTLTDTIKVDRSDLDIVFEIMLKMGVHLDYVVSEIIVGNRKCYSVGEKAFETSMDCILLICLDKWITPDDIAAFCDLAPAKIIAAEEAFEDDTALSNAHYILQDRDIEMKLL